MQPTNDMHPENEAARAEFASAEQALETEPQEETKALEDRLLTAERERDDYLDMAQRIKAEFENFRRRTNAVRTEAWEDGARDTIALFLPVIDNLERALETNTERTPLCEGIELIYKQMLEILGKRGIEVIDRVGEPFDPELENAVMQADASEGEPGTVASVMQKGYKTRDRVIRHAMVRVVAG